MPPVNGGKRYTLAAYLDNGKRGGIGDEYLIRPRAKTTVVLLQNYRIGVHGRVGSPYHLTGE